LRLGSRGFVEGVVEGVSERSDIERSDIERSDIERSDRERCEKSEEGVEIGGQLRKTV
jgi:hypothetical protein